MLTALPLLVPQGIYWAIGLTVLLVAGWALWRRPGAGASRSAAATTAGAGPALPAPGLGPFAGVRPVADAALPLLLLAFAGAELLVGALHGSWAQAGPVAAAALAGALVCLLLARWPLPAWTFWGGLVVGGLGAGSWALWQKIVDGVVRADGHGPLHAIFFGNLSLLTGLLCLAGIAWAWNRAGGRLWTLLLVLAAAGGVLASALSGTRGGWLALPFTLAVLHGGFVRHWPRFRRRTALLGVLLVAAVLYLTPQTGVERRVDLAVAEARDYLGGSARGSVGSRLEMYRGALHLIREQPLIGLGHEGYRPAMGELAAAGLVTRSAARHWHAHNDLLDAWVRRGLPALLALLGLLAWPLWRFGPLLLAAGPQQRALGAAGVLMPAAFLDFGLSYAFFAYPFAVALYGCWLAQLLAMARVVEASAPARATTG